MDNAELFHQSHQEDFLPDVFWQHIGPNRRSRDGLVRETALDQNYSMDESLFEAGSFSQDICWNQPGNTKRINSQRRGCCVPSILFFVRLMYDVLLSIHSH